jgi:hypothetical protein
MTSTDDDLMKLAQIEVDAISAAEIKRLRAELIALRKSADALAEALGDVIKAPQPRKMDFDFAVALATARITLTAYEGTK